MKKFIEAREAKVAEFDALTVELEEWTKQTKSLTLNSSVQLN